MMTEERPEDRIARSCIATRVRTLNRMVTGIYDEVLRPHGLKGSQLTILVAAAKLGLARPAQVCEILKLDASTLSRNVDRMQARGWLEAVPEEDRRLQSFRLTAAGRALLKRAAPAWEKAQAQASSLIGEDGLQALARIERKLGR